MVSKVFVVMVSTIMEGLVTAATTMAEVAIWMRKTSSFYPRAKKYETFSWR